MKRAIIAMIFLLLTGCGMNNEEIVEDVIFCNEHGMGVEFRKDGFGYIRRVYCVPNGDNAAPRR